MSLCITITIHIRVDNRKFIMYTDNRKFIVYMDNRKFIVYTANRKFNMYTANRKFNMYSIYVLHAGKQHASAHYKQALGDIHATDD